MGLRDLLTFSWDYDCLKTSIVVGPLFHLFSYGMNHEHFNEIYRNFAEGNILKGSLATFTPFLIPYSVAMYTKIKAERKQNNNTER